MKSNSRIKLNTSEVQLAGLAQFSRPATSVTLCRTKEDLDFVRFRGNMQHSDALALSPHQVFD